MRILIMCDMEGVSGIVTWDQVGGGKAGYAEGRALYTAEVNAAVRGAARAGAAEIIVIDGHNAGGDWRYNSLLKDKLDPACEYVAHHTWTDYRAPLEAGVDACLMVGYHARNNVVDGVLAHTISSAQCRNLWFNDVLVGEVGVNGALCGHCGGQARAFKVFGEPNRAPTRARNDRRGRVSGAAGFERCRPLCTSIARDHYLRVWPLRHDDELRAARGCRIGSTGDEANQPR